MKPANTAPKARPNRGAIRAPASFLKWAGGKGANADRILAAILPSSGTYYEPMAGSGSVFLRLSPERAVLSDTNPELMSCWEVVRDDVEALIQALTCHVDQREHFLAVRALDPAGLSKLERAARTIYLNKTCFNGLYRLNRRGEFNVPYGRHRSPRVVDTETLRRVSKQLRGVTLRCCDFADAVVDAVEGDVCYFDPPYHNAEGRSCFNRYMTTPFTEDDHRRLAALVHRLAARGCRVAVSNSDTPLVRALYAGLEIQSFTVRRPVNRVASRRGGWTELLIHNK